MNWIKLYYKKKHNLIIWQVAVQEENKALRINYNNEYQ